MSPQNGRGENKDIASAVTWEKYQSLLGNWIFIWPQTCAIRFSVVLKAPQGWAVEHSCNSNDKTFSLNIIVNQRGNCIVNLTRLDYYSKSCLYAFVIMYIRL